MKKTILGMFLLVATIATTGQSAHAGGLRHISTPFDTLFTPVYADQRLAAVSLGVGAASTAAFFAFNDWNWKWNSSRHGITALGAGVVTGVGCAALSPIVGTAVVNRPLTYREAHMLIADCVIPFIGGWLVNAAYNNHVLWAPDEGPPRTARGASWTGATWAHARFTHARLTRARLMHARSPRERWARR